jgi:hypothetical protein
MSIRQLETLIWVLIYAGLFGVGLGMWFMDRQLMVGWTIFAGGCTLVAIGALLIWVRSRRG